MILKITRYILACLWIIIASLFTLIFSIIFPFRRWTTYYIARVIGLPMLKIFGMKVHVEGKEHIKDAHPCIYASNHQSNFDMYIIGSNCPFRTVSLGKRSIVFFPLFGLVYWLSGQILINRSNKKSAQQTMNRTAQIMNQQNVSIWIMPEGTRSKGKGLLPFKKGAFHTAIAAQRPVVPVSVSHYVKDLDLTKWISAEITMKFHSPIPTESMTSQDINNLIEQCRNTIEPHL